jgi:riboflavin synthase
VSLIPETLSATVLGDLVPGDRANIETDILARQVQRMLQFDVSTRASRYSTTEGVQA